VLPPRALRASAALQDRMHRLPMPAHAFRAVPALSQRVRVRLRVMPARREDTVRMQGGRRASCGNHARKGPIAPPPARKVSRCALAAPPASTVSGLAQRAAPSASNAALEATVLILEATSAAAVSRASISRPRARRHARTAQRATTALRARQRRFRAQQAHVRTACST
jgi:hypothetical protein